MPFVFLLRKQLLNGPRHLQVPTSSLGGVDSGINREARLGSPLPDDLEATEPWDKLLGKVLEENILCTFGAS